MYSSELCMSQFCHKSVDRLGRGTAQCLFRVKEVCKLRLENDPHDYSSLDIEQILQSSVQRKSEWHMQFINTSKIRTTLIDCYQTNHYNVYQKKNQKLSKLSNGKINAYSVASTIQTFYFDYLWSSNYKFQHVDMNIARLLHVGAFILLVLISWNIITDFVIFNRLVCLIVT